MAEQKRFYWIKLKEDFFINNEVTDWIISQPNGCEYIVLYLKLCILTANKGGRLALEIGEMLIPYDSKKIAADTKFDIDTVIVAMELFQRIGLIYEESDGVLKIPYVDEIVGSETPAAIKKRKQRAKQKLLQGDSSGDNVPQEKEFRVKSLELRDSDIDADVEVKADSPPCDYTDSENKLEPFRKNVMLSDNQISDLLDKMGLEAFDYYVDKLGAFIEDKGAFVKNHYETLLKWYNEDRAVKYS